MLLCGDSCTRALGTQEDVVDDIPIFGDGGCATILEYDKNAKPIWFDMGNIGSKADTIGFKNGGFRNPPTLEMFKENGKFDYGDFMDGLAIFDFTMNTVPVSINNIMKLANVSENDVAYYILHQANRMILENIAVSANIDVDKVLRGTLNKYGNLSSASVASVISDEYERFNQKQCRILLNAFGIGLSWGSALIELTNTICLPMILYKEN